MAAASSSATLTLGSSAQVTLPAFPTQAGTANLTFDFTSGYLSPYSASSNYMSGLTHAYLTANGARFNVDTGKDITIAQVLENATSQAGKLTKLGSGALTLSGANSYSGGTTINDGTVTSTVVAATGGNSALGLADPTNVITINGGELTGSDNNWLDNTGLASNGTNAHAVVVNAGGKLSGASGNITGLGNVTLNGGTIEVSNGLSFHAWNGSFTLGGDITVSGSAASSITTIGDGGAANIQMSDGANNVGGTRTFTVNDVTNNANSDLIVRARLANGTVKKAGAGTLELATGSTGTGTHVDWNITDGTVLASAASVIGGAVTVNGSAASLNIGANSQSVGAVALKGGASITGTSGTLTGSSYAVESGSISAILGGAVDLTKTTSGTVTLSGASSYTGVTTIAGGTLNAATFTDYTVAGSLGTRANADAGDDIGILFLGGTLQYTGSTAQSTNRQIRIGTSGGTIDASGTDSGTLSFTHSGTNANLFDTPGTRTLTLTGSNTENNTFAITLENQSANATSLTKSGTGKWVLTGANSYSGTTTISAGTLALSGSGTLGSGKLSLEATSATLDLGGTTQSLGGSSTPAMQRMARLAPSPTARST